MLKKMLSRAQQMSDRKLTDKQCEEIYTIWGSEENELPLIPDSPIGKQIFTWLAKRQKNPGMKATSPLIFCQGGSVKGQAY